MATWSRALALAAGLCCLAASAHPRGFHKKILFTAQRTSLEALVVMDVDGAERTRGLRAAADKDGNGKLSPAELQDLKQKVVAMATHALKLSMSGAPVPVVVQESKLSVHGDFGISDAGFSLAALLVMKHPQPVTPGLKLVIEDQAPDLSEVAVEVYQVTLADAGAAEPTRADLKPGEKLEVRLGALADRPPSP